MVRPRGVEWHICMLSCQVKVSLGFIESADEDFLARHSFELRIERLVLVAQLRLEPFEIGPRVPAVQSKPPTAYFRRSEQRRPSVTCSLREQLRPGPTRSIDASEFLFAPGRRPEFPDADMHLTLLTRPADKKKAGQDIVLPGPECSLIGLDQNPTLSDAETVRGAPM